MKMKMKSKKNMSKMVKTENCDLDVRLDKKK